MNTNTNKLHRKRKGSIGEQAIILDLLKQNMAVFAEVGDLSRVDMIALIGNQSVRIQVKARTPDNGVVKVRSAKSGPGYRYKYAASDFDVLAVYNINIGDIAYVNINEFLSVSELYLRVNQPKNNQISGIKMFNSYSKIEDAI